MVKIKIYGAIIDYDLLVHFLNTCIENTLNNR